MKLLLDTHIALWALSDDSRLPEIARGLILDQNNEIYYSGASIWEITIKHTSHPDELVYGGEFVANGIVISLNKRNYCLADFIKQ